MDEWEETSEGLFGEFQITDVPKLKAIIYAEFDLLIGPIIRYQVPHEVFTADRFSTFAATVIPKHDLLNRMIKIILSDFKVIGHPIGLEAQDPRYPRGKHIFNMCFVVPKESTVDCMYEPLVQKVAEYLISIEQECWFLQERRDEIPKVMQHIFDGINQNGECVVPLTKETTMYLKLCPAYRGVEPPKVSLYMAPMFARKVDRADLIRLIEKMDVLSQKIIPQIDGVRCVKEIAAIVQIDPDLVMRCIRNLHFYESVSLVPLFLYSNTYVATEKLHNFYSNPKEIEECLEFVRLRDANGTKISTPLFSDVFRLFMSLKCGQTLRDWVDTEHPRRYGVDERRLVQFGMHHRFLRKLSIYPVSVVSSSSGCAGKLASLCDGTNALEDLAVAYGIMPDVLQRMLEDSKQFEFISK